MQWLGVVIGGWQWCLFAKTASERNDADARITLDTAAFYAAHILPRALMHEAVVKSGSGAIASVAPSSI